MRNTVNGKQIVWTLSSWSSEEKKIRKEKKRKGGSRRYRKITEGNENFCKSGSEVTLINSRPDQEIDRVLLSTHTRMAFHCFLHRSLRYYTCYQEQKQHRPMDLFTFYKSQHPSWSHCMHFIWPKMKCFLLFLLKHWLDIFSSQMQSVKSSAFSHLSGTCTFWFYFNKTHNSGNLIKGHIL